MRSIKGLLVGLVLAGLALAPTAAFAHGGGGGNFGGGGHFGGGVGHFGGGHFGGAGHFASFAGHSFAQHQGAHFARNEDRFRHGGHFFFADPFWYDYPYYGYNDQYYGYYDDYSDGQSSPAELTPSQETVIAVQKELAQLGYYHSDVDGLIGPQTERAIRWFQSVDKLPVTGQIDDPTLKALRIS
jgi:Putative peptidoglycan binding domain